MGVLFQVWRVFLCLDIMESGCCCCLLLVLSVVVVQIPYNCLYRLRYVFIPKYLIVDHALTCLYNFCVLFASSENFRRGLGGCTGTAHREVRNMFRNVLSILHCSSNFHKCPPDFTDMFPNPLPPVSPKLLGISSQIGRSRSPNTQKCPRWGGGSGGL